MKTAAKMGSAKATMVEKTSRLELVATLRSRKSGGWCRRGGVHRQVADEVVDDAAKASGVRVDAGCMVASV